MKLAQSLILAVAAASFEDDNSLLQNMATRQLSGGGCQTIEKAADCKAAADATDGLVWKKAHVWAGRPHGCIQRTGRKGVSFNKHEGKANPKFHSVCLQAPPSPTSEPEEDIEDVVDGVVDDVIEAAEDIDADDVDTAVNVVGDADLDDAANAADTVVDEVEDAIDGTDEDVVTDVGDVVTDVVDPEAMADVVETAVDSVWERLVEAISSSWGDMDSGEVCIEVEKGEVAPVPGIFVSNSGNYDANVVEAEEAPEGGQFCVEVDLTHWEEVPTAIGELDENDTDVCFDVEAGAVAPLRGDFTDGVNLYPVRPGTKAPVAGEYCVELFDGL